MGSIEPEFERISASLDLLRGCGFVTTKHSEPPAILIWSVGWLAGVLSGAYLIINNEAHFKLPSGYLCWYHPEVAGHLARLLLKSRSSKPSRCRK